MQKSAWETHPKKSCTALPRGAILSDRNRLCFPAALVEDLVNVACKEFVHFGATPDRDIHFGGDRVYFRTCGEAVSVLDYESRETRPSTLEDLYDFVRLVDCLDNIHGYAQTVIATELSENVFEHDINVLYALVSGTRKPLAMSTAAAAHRRPGERHDESPQHHCGCSANLSTVAPPRPRPADAEQEPAETAS